MLFVAALVIQAPQGGLSGAPLGIAERAASGMSEGSVPEAVPAAFPTTQFALAN